MTGGDADPTAQQEMVAFLRQSECFDENFYCAKAGLPLGADGPEHYIRSGWQNGLNPNATFDGEFLRPFYEATGLSGPPAVTWLELCAMGRTLPSNAAEAEAPANLTRASASFDAGRYARHLPPGMDPALHYVVVGECMGWRPSEGFDPVYYLERYPDIAAAGVSPLLHFDAVGRQEGRRAQPRVDGLVIPFLPPDGLPIVVILSHEMSRTGAPLLGWSLMRHLSRHYRLVSIAMKGGDLEPDFRAVAAASIGPLALEDRHPVELRRIAQRIVEAYRPLYAVVNSIEARALGPYLVELGVPTVALIHEFAAYTRPLQEMWQIYAYASHVVFPAHTVAQSSFQAFPELRRRAGVHVRAQGPIELPPYSDATATPGQGAAPPPSPSVLADVEGCFVVLGAGFVQLRKGVDLFIAVAAAAKRMRPQLSFRFIWVGGGYDPIGDVQYSAYLAEQILHSDLGDSLCIVDSVSDLEPFYARADAFLLTSRLDPQPNVGIDAVTRGIPTICFEGACGTAEILAADPETRRLVVPHLDAHAAAEEICRLCEESSGIDSLRRAVARVGREAYRFDEYVQFIDSLGQEAAKSFDAEDLEALVSSEAVDPVMFPMPDGEVLPSPVLERIALLRWRLWGKSDGTPLIRRPCAGFHPQIYARAHASDCIDGERDPLAHWVQFGRHSGPWSRKVYLPQDPLQKDRTVKIALHCHFHYPELAADFCARLLRNDAHVDLFISTDTEDKAVELQGVFKICRNPFVIRVFPNRGRDIGPFLTGFGGQVLRGGYDVFGHVHAKRSLATGTTLGEAWRNFLWENLIGGEHAMVDLAASAFGSDPNLGLLMAEDPHLVEWNENRAIAEDLAGRMGLTTPLDDAFDFPLGTMFWARPEALRPLLELNLDWKDYPVEPLPYDGTMLHALERLLPFVVRHAGYEVAGMRAPYTTW